MQKMRLLRLDRDFHFEYMESLPDLYEAKGRNRKDAFLEENPHRTWEFAPPELLEEQRTGAPLALNPKP